MAEINFLESFYENLPNSKDLFSVLDGLSNANTPNGVSVIPFGSEKEFDEIIIKHQLSRREIQKEKETEGLTLYKLSHFGKNKSKADRTGRFIHLKMPGTKYTNLAITLDDSTFFHNDLRPFFKSLYPDIIYTFLKSKKLKDLIEKFKVVNEFSEIKITRASHILRFEDNRPMSAVTWPKVTLEEAFDWMKENNGWFKSLQFEAKRNQKTFASVFIDRGGVVRTNGIFEQVLNSFLIPTCHIIETNFKQFSNRDRRTSETKEARPLIIQYNDNVFDKIEENQTFIKAISKIDNSSVSVIHGNPYIHISLIDYFDGSSYDMWVLNNNEIIIVPQMKGTVASIKRIVNHIFDTFAEGEIKEYEYTYQ